MSKPKFHKIDSFYIKTKFPKHKELKNVFLQLIDKLPKKAVDNVTNSDWSLPREYKREYLDLFYTEIKPVMESIKEMLFCQSWTIQNGWFQQYYKKDYHEWHNHVGAHYGNVYFLELPNKKYKTQFFNVSNKKLYNNIEIEEGDILTTSANIPHRSISNLTNQRKTVIVFNSHFENVSNNKIQNILKKN